MTARIHVVDFQVPPTEHGWYGVICDAGSDISTVAVTGLAVNGSIIEAAVAAI